jgi:hypothetical protein
LIEIERPNDYPVLGIVIGSFENIEKDPSDSVLCLRREKIGVFALLVDKIVEFPSMRRHMNELYRLFRFWLADDRVALLSFATSVIVILTPPAPVN